ncbi:MAG: hypothetical protein WC551_04240 [Patescibacteria group bacterium]
MPASSLFSRIMLTFGAIAVAGFTFWFLFTSLAPVDVPPPPQTRGALHFDARTDLSKDPRFMQLSPLLQDFNIVPGNLGRVNPFMPLPPPPTPVMSTTTATGTQMVAPTSTAFETPTPTSVEALMPAY